MQIAFNENHGLQCGFCTPGMIMTAVDMVQRLGKRLDEADIRQRAGRQHLPLHRLREHRQGHPGRRNQNVERYRLCESGSPREESAMANDGIGVSVLRKEDRRFTTGQGNYTDDVNRPGQLHAVFVRSPHAHADDQGGRRLGGRQMPGVAAIHTGEELEAGGIKNLICGWMITFQGRLADEDGTLSAARHWHRCASSANRCWRWSRRPAARPRTPRGGQDRL